MDEKVRYGSKDGLMVRQETDIYVCGMVRGKQEECVEEEGRGGGKEGGLEARSGWNNKYCRIKRCERKDGGTLRNTDHDLYACEKVRNGWLERTKRRDRGWAGSKEGLE